MDDGCDLCGENQGGVQRLHGLRVCGVCSEGPLAGRMRGWGADIETTRWQIAVDVPGKPQQVVHHAKSVAKGPGGGPKHARFSRERLGHKMSKLFHAELQAKDARFDDLVFVDTRDEEGTAALLSVDGARSAIAALVVAGGEVEVGPEMVSYYARGSELPKIEGVELGLCCLLRHASAR